MFPACQAPPAPAPPPRGGRTGSDRSCPDAGSAQTAPTDPAVLLGTARRRPGVQSRDDVIGIAHQDDVPPGMMASPPLSPEIEDVMCDGSGCLDSFRGE